MNTHFKLFVRDQNPNVVERMDQHVSVVTEAEDADGNSPWEKPTDSPTGGFGRYSFITHFGKWETLNVFSQMFDYIILNVIYFTDLSRNA